MRKADLIEKFVNDGATHGEASRIFVDGDILYSYGRHFPLLVRVDWGFILNADKYSSTTSGHQSDCFKYATIQLPFSALRGAGILTAYGTWGGINLHELQAIEVLAHEEQRWDKTGKWTRWVYGDGGRGRQEVISDKEYKALSKKEQPNWYEQEERRPESAVLKVGEKYYLSSMDGYQYFLSELPEPVTTVKDALACLKPKEVKDDNFVRQGEWFFVQTDELPMQVSKDMQPIGTDEMRKLFYKCLNQNFVLPVKQTTSHEHIASRGAIFNDTIYVSGRIRHPEHRCLKLSHYTEPVIFMAFENRALGSWSAQGRVD